MDEDQGTGTGLGPLEAGNARGPEPEPRTMLSVSGRLRIDPGGGDLAPPVTPKIPASPEPVAPEVPPPPPSYMRRVGPGVGMVILSATAGVTLQGTAGLLAATLVTAPVAMLLFPPDRHEFRHLYRRTHWGILFALFLIGVMFVLQYTLVRGISLITPLTGWAPIAPLILLTAFLGTGTAAFLACWWLQAQGLGASALGFYVGRFRRHVWVGLQAGLSMACLNVLSLKLTRSLDIWQLDPQSVVSLFFSMESAGGVLAGLLGGALLIPICEEILFRGVLFAAIRRSRGPIPAIILSSTLFGVLHAPDMLLPMTIGFILSCVYHTTGNLWSCIIGHAVINTAALALAWNHGLLLGHLPWNLLGGLLGLAGLVFVISADHLGGVPDKGTDGCPSCGAPWERAERCPCGHPGRRRLSSNLRWLARGIGFSFCLACGLFASLVDRFLQMDDEPPWTSSVLWLKYGLLDGEGRSLEAKAMALRWVAREPENLVPRFLQAMEDYHHGSFAAAHARLTAIQDRPMDQATRTVFTNMMALILAEEGGPARDAAIHFANEALRACLPKDRVNIEDTLGWALFRAGRVKEAQPYLDRSLSIFGILYRKSVAETCYHRGAMLWAIGQKDRAREVLELAFRTGPVGGIFFERCRNVLATDRLPDDLLPPSAPGSNTPQAPR